MRITSKQRTHARNAIAPVAQDAYHYLLASAGGHDGLGHESTFSSARDVSLIGRCERYENAVEALDRIVDLASGLGLNVEPLVALEMPSVERVRTEADLTGLSKAALTRLRLWARTTLNLDVFSASPLWRK